MTEPHPTTERFERAREGLSTQQYVLRLCVVGASATAQRAIGNTRDLCERYLPGRHTLEVVDVRQQPDRIIGDQIIVAPTLFRLEPLPVVRVIGDMSDTEKVLAALDIRPAR